MRISINIGDSNHSCFTIFSKHKGKCLANFGIGVFSLDIEDYFESRMLR
jgi:hypothetical protein